MIRVAHTELQSLQRPVIEREVAVDLAPHLLVEHVEVLIAEDPAERHRYAARRGRGIDGVAEVPVGSGGDAVQHVGGAGADAGIGFEHVLVGRAAVTGRDAYLGEEGEFVGRLDVHVEVAEVGARTLVGARDLVVDPVRRAGDRRERRRRQRIALHAVTGLSPRPGTAPLAALPAPPLMKLLPNSR